MAIWFCSFHDVTVPCNWLATIYDPVAPVPIFRRNDFFNFCSFPDISVSDKALEWPEKILSVHRMFDCSRCPITQANFNQL